MNCGLAVSSESGNRSNCQAVAHIELNDPSKFPIAQRRGSWLATGLPDHPDDRCSMDAILVCDLLNHDALFVQCNYLLPLRS